MQLIKTYEQTGIYDPTNPTQYKREAYVGIPGGYGSFYWNTVPNTATLGGLRGAGFWSSIPVWGQAVIIAGAAVAGGYFGWSRFGGTIKSKLGLSGSRRRRR